MFILTIRSLPNSWQKSFYSLIVRRRFRITKVGQTSLWPHSAYLALHFVKSFLSTRAISSKALLPMLCIHLLSIFQFSQSWNYGLGNISKWPNPFCNRWANMKWSILLLTCPHFFSIVEEHTVCPLLVSSSANLAWTGCQYIGEHRPVANLIDTPRTYLNCDFRFKQPIDNYRGVNYSSIM